MTARRGAVPPRPTSARESRLREARPRALVSGTLVLEHYLPYRLNVLAALVSQGVAKRYAARFKIDLPEWRVIAALGEWGQLTAKEIGAKSHMHKTKVSRAIGQLATRKLVERRPNERDLREAFVRLTREGRQLYVALAPTAIAYGERLSDGLQHEDIATLDRLLRALTERAQALLDDGDA
jgi:DNA-binding MarR family transcriptional regulator